MFENGEYKSKRCSKKKCCKQCSNVKFKATMTKWPVHKQTHRATQQHVEHKDATDIKHIFLSDFVFCCFICY